MTHNTSGDERMIVGRRPLLKTVGLGVSGTAIFMSSAGTASARSDELAHELNTVRETTRKYRDVELARSEGYGTEVSPYTPGMGFHFVNPMLGAPDEEGPFDLESPPILVYVPIGTYRNEIREALDESTGFIIHEPTRDDELHLAAVEFAHAGDSGAPGSPANIFSDEGASRNLKVSEDSGWEWVPGPDITALHVWVHRANSAGVFHPTNPTLD